IAGVRFETYERTANRLHVNQPAFDRRRAAGTIAELVLVNGSDLSFPKLRSLDGIKRQDKLAFSALNERDRATLGDRDRRVTVAALDLPKQLGAGRWPRRQQSCFRRGAIAPRSQPIRPIIGSGGARNRQGDGYRKKNGCSHCALPCLRQFYRCN